MLAALLSALATALTAHSEPSAAAGGPDPWPSDFTFTLYMLDSHGWYHKNVTYRNTTRQMRTTVVNASDPRARDCVILFDSRPVRPRVET